MKELSLKELQAYCLDILQDVHNFCESNNIKYSLYAGTMLGAIRHGGYIPWDDDIDIIMPRPDYERFCNTYKSKMYDLVNYAKDKQCLIAFTRVCDRKKTIISSRLPWCTGEVGCWIDIFPADGDVEDNKARHLLYKDCINLRKKLLFHRGAKAHFCDSIVTNVRLLMKKFLTLNGCYAGMYVEQLTKKCQTYEYGKHEYWVSLTNVRSFKEWKHHPIDTFSHCHLTKFEDRKFYVADGYDTILTQRFGDYMKLPPKEHQIPKQSYIHFYWKEK